MKRKLIAIITALVLSVSLVACSTNKTDKAEDNTQTEQTETVNYVLTDFVSGLKDWTVEINAKNIDFMDGVEYNDEVVKEVKVDDSKVDFAKEGKYDLVYTIVPLDDTVSDVAVTKKVTVKVVSVEEAQKEADAGKQVATSNNEVKKDSEGKTPVAKPEKKPAETPAKNPENKPSKPADGNNGNSKPDNKPAEKPADKPSKPDNGNDNNQGGNKPHSHTWKDVSTSAGDCSHKGKVTQKCTGCGETRTVDGNFGEHNYKHVAEKSHMAEREVSYTVDVPVYTTIGWYECKVCHAQFDNTTDCAYHCLMECDSTYTYKTKQEQTGTKQETRYKTEQYKVIDDPEHDECSVCGKRK